MYVNITTRATNHKIFTVNETEINDKTVYPSSEWQLIGAVNSNTPLQSYDEAKRENIPQNNNILQTESSANGSLRSFYLMSTVAAIPILLIAWNVFHLS